jgi:hypothetical protein
MRDGRIIRTLADAHSYAIMRRALGLMCAMRSFISSSGLGPTKSGSQQRMLS